MDASVQVAPEFLGKLHKQAIKKIKKEITIPGFRKGKAPDDAITARYSGHIQQELNQLFVQAAYQALSEVGDRRPLSPKAILSTSIIKSDVNEGGHIKFTYEAFPVVPSIEWEKISLAEEAASQEISEEEMQKGLVNIAHFFAVKTPVTRPSQEGDFISLSLHVSQRDQEERSPAAVFENKYFKLCDEDMTDTFKAKFLNVSAGHRVTEVIHSPEIQSFLNGDLLTFTVNAVIQVDVPELDDEKARQLQADSLEDLKNKLRLQLETQANNRKHQQRFTEAENALASTTDFDLPKSMLDERMEILTREKLLNARLIQYCSDDELEGKKADLINEAKEEAKKSLKLFFLANKIFNEEQLTISREELQHMMDVCSRERFGLQPPRDISNDVIQELVMIARDRLTYNKAIEVILSKVKNSLTLSPA